MVRIARRVLPVVLALAAVGAFGPAAAVDRDMLRLIKDNPPIRDIVIDGNAHYSDGRIREQMYARPRTFWAALKGDRRSRLQRETLDRDTLEIKYLYLRSGFLGVRISESFEPMETGAGVRVRTVIDEGRRSVYGDVRIQGEYPPRLESRFQRAVRGLKQGAPVNYFDLVETGFEMKAVLANNGYPYAAVTPEVDTGGPDGATAITYAITADSLVRFGGVSVRGVKRYPEYTAVRELKFKPGDVYRRQDLIDSERRLFESGYFSTLQLQQEAQQSDRYRPDFVLQVRERKPYYLSFTTGAGQSEAADLTWSVTSGAGKRNLFGSRRLEFYNRVEFSLGADARLTDHLYRLRYTEPWLLGFRMPLAVTLEYQPRIRHEAQDFDVEEWNASLSTTRRVGRLTDVTAGIEYQSVDISGVPAELEEAVRAEVEGLSIRRRLYLNLRRDSRLDVFVPRQGSVRDLRTEYYGGFLGGDEHFYRLEGSWSFYRPVWPGWISATRFRSGYAHAFGDSELVPSKDRFFLGGANTIRGFAENTLAPTLADSLPGANFTVVCNQEFRWKTLQVFAVVPLLNKLLENMPLWQTVFIDIGNGFTRVSEFSFSRLAYSYGTGVQIISPAGPIRLDYARRIETDDIPFDDRWHFTILFAF